MPFLCVFGSHFFIFYFLPRTLVQALVSAWHMLIFLNPANSFDFESEWRWLIPDCLQFQLFELLVFLALNFGRRATLSVTQDRAEKWICVCLSVKKNAQTQKVNACWQWSNCLPNIRTLVTWFMSGLSLNTSRICSHTLNQSSYATTSVVLWLARVQGRMQTVYWTRMLYAFHITAILKFTFLFTFPKEQLKLVKLLLQHVTNNNSNCEFVGDGEH